MNSVETHGSSAQARSAVSEPGNARIHPFPLTKHLAELPSVEHKREHLRYTLESWLTTYMMIAACRTMKVPARFKPRAGQYKQIEDELHEVVRKDKYTRVLVSMPFFGGFNVTDLDFDKMTSSFDDIEYPSYYQQPFHSIPGGWLSPVSALGDRAAFRALYVKAHKHGAPGIREDIADLIPRDAKVIYDFGAGAGDQAAAYLARLGTDALVHCIEPSPFMIAMGQHNHPNERRMRWKHGFVERQDLPKASADAVNLMFVSHECPNTIKRKLLESAYAVLKPGGVLIWTDPPHYDLVDDSRGFFEPYKFEWYEWRPDEELSKVGFSQVVTHQIVAEKYMWTRVAQKPR